MLLPKSLTFRAFYSMYRWYSATVHDTRRFLNAVSVRLPRDVHRGSNTGLRVFADVYTRKNM